MKELLIILSSAMSFDEIIDKMSEEIEVYKSDPTKENRQKLIITSMLLSSKESIEQAGSGYKGVEKVLSKMESIDKAEKFFNKSES